MVMQPLLNVWLDTSCQVLPSNQYAVSPPPRSQLVTVTAVKLLLGATFTSKKALLDVSNTVASEVPGSDV